LEKKKIIQSVIFLIIGICLFWLVFRNTNLDQILTQLTRFNLLWIGASVGINIISQLIRAYRWKLLFKPLNYKPKIFNLFLAIIILAFTNQIIPRGGEFSRLGVINRVEKIPFSKLLGIALAERTTDFIVLILIAIGILIWQFSSIQKLLHLPQVDMQQINYIKTFIIIAVSIGIIAVTIFIIKRFGWFRRTRVKIRKIRNDIAKGFSSLRRIKHKPLYTFYTILIYILWLLALYVIFFAYPPTSDLPLKAAIFTFGLATLAFLLPVQAGIGAWHFIVIQCLVLYGIDTESGKVFSLVAHATTNLIFIALGAISFMLIPLINKKSNNYKSPPSYKK